MGLTCSKEWGVGEGYLLPLLVVVMLSRGDSLFFFLLPPGPPLFPVCEGCWLWNSPECLNGKGTCAEALWRSWGRLIICEGGVVL